MIDKRDSQEMIKLAREGKAISKIWEENFPHYDYWDIYIEVYLAGEKSAVGTKRAISNRLKKLKGAGADQELIDEINGLIWHLYNRYKESQQKLEKARKALQ